MNKFHNSRDERLLKNQATLMFEELSDGVYLVVKDRLGKYMEYASSIQVYEALNHIHNVVVINRGGGKGYTNFDFDCDNEYMKKYFVTKSLIGFLVIYEAFDKDNGGNHYVSVSEEFETEDEAQAYADKLNE